MRRLPYFVLPLLALAGFFVAVTAFGAPGDPGVTCDTATATASVSDRTLTGPSHVLSRDGGSIYTEPGDVVTSAGTTATATKQVCVTQATVTVTFELS